MSEFHPSAEVDRIGGLAVSTCLRLAPRSLWTPATLREAARLLEPCRPRLAKRLRLLAAIWLVNYKNRRSLD